MPEHEPQPGQAVSSYTVSSFCPILPALQAPTASNTFERLRCRPSRSPPSIGPPLTTRDGMFVRAAAISMPGTILSQLGM